MPSKGPKSGGDSQYNAGRDQNVANVGKVEPGGIGQQINNINQAPEPEVRIPRVGKPEQRADGLYVTTYEVHIDSAYAVNRIELQVHSCRELPDPSYSLGPVDCYAARLRGRFRGALAAAAPAAAAPAASVDAEAAYRKAAISALRNRPEFGQRLASGHGVAWGKVQAWLTQAAPPEEVVGDRFEWAYQVVRPALLEILGPEGSGWRTEKRPHPNVLGRLRPGYCSPKPWRTSNTRLPRKNSRSLPHTRATPTITWPSRGAACTGCPESGYHSRPSTTPGGS